MGEIKYKVQKYILQKWESEWEHKKSERMLKKIKMRRKKRGREAPDRLEQASAGKAVFC